MSSELVKKFNDAVDELLQYEMGHQLRERLIIDDITGIPGDCHNCPVSVWLARRIDVRSSRISVDGESCQLWAEDGDESLPLPLGERHSPVSVRAFIDAFDGLEPDTQLNDYVDDELRPYLPLLRRSTNDDADG